MIALGLILPGMIPLALAGLAHGVISGILFRRLVDRGRLRETVNRILAHVMEFRLFVEEPRLVFRSQIEALLENLRLMRLVVRPILTSFIVFAVFYGPMDRRFGYAPVRRGETAVVNLPLGGDLRPSPNFAVETIGVRVPRLNRVYWRVRVVHESTELTKPAPIGVMPWQAWFLFFSAASAAATARIR